MNSKKHIEMLAHGLGNEMLSEIKTEVESIDTTLEEFGVSPQDLRPESQFALKRVKGFIADAERIASSLYNYERRIGDIKRGAGVKDITQLEEQLNQCNSVQEMGRIKRQLTHLKSIHSRKLSELVSNEQQLLHERLRLIGIWKSILNYEIHVLEECKSIIIKTIVTSANTSGDETIIEMVRDRLRSLTIKDSVFTEMKLDMSTIKVANIHVLHKTLNEQLDDIDRIESVVEEKREIVLVLNSIAQNIRSKLPDAPPEAPMEVIPTTAERVEETPSQPMPKPVEPGKQSRMTFQDKQNK